MRSIKLTGCKNSIICRILISLPPDVVNIYSTHRRKLLTAVVPRGERGRHLTHLDVTGSTAPSAPQTTTLQPYSQALVASNTLPPRHFITDVSGNGPRLSHWT